MKIAPLANVKQSMKENSIGQKTIPIHMWNDEQLELLANTVLNEGGFISTYNESMEIKWKRIKWKLESSKNREFVLSLPLWEGLYRQYKTFKRDLLKRYEINSDCMDISHLEEFEKLMPEWAILIIKMEKYRVTVNQYASDQARLNWKRNQPFSFFIFIFCCFLFVIIDIILVAIQNEWAIILQSIIITLAFITFFIGQFAAFYYFPKDYPVHFFLFRQYEYMKTNDENGNLIIQKVSFKTNNSSIITPKISSLKDNSDKPLPKIRSQISMKIQKRKQLNQSLDNKQRYTTDELKHMTSNTSNNSYNNYNNVSISLDDSKSDDNYHYNQHTQEFSKLDTNFSNDISDLHSTNYTNINDISKDTIKSEPELELEYEIIQTTNLDRLLFISFDKECALELLCLLVGSIFINSNPGIASLRIFRLFRYLSYLRYVDDIYEDDDVPPQSRPFSFTKACRLFAFYMEQLFFEFATQKSLGGSLLICIFLFSTYCVSVVFWYNRPDITTVEGQSCKTLYDCYMTMIRLVFYDGTGFDYLNQLVDEGYNNVGYIIMLIMFIIFNGIVLINGLIGIFGNTFTTDDDIIAKTFKKLHDVDERIDALANNLHDFQKTFNKVIENIKDATDSSHNQNNENSYNENYNNNKPSKPNPLSSTCRRKKARSNNKNNTPTFLNSSKKSPNLQSGSKNAPYVTDIDIGNISDEQIENAVTYIDVDDDDDSYDDSSDGSEILEEWGASYSESADTLGVLTLRTNLTRNLVSKMNSSNLGNDSDIKTPRNFQDLKNIANHQSIQSKRLN